MKQKTVFLALLVFSFLIIETPSNDCYADMRSYRVKEIQEIRKRKAIVIDDRISVLRKDSDIKSQVIRRLSIGRSVFVLGYRSGSGKEAGFYRVALTKRVRGWIHEAALAITNRKSDDLKLMSLIEKDYEGFERMRLCRLFIDYFSQSSFLPKIMLIFGSEAEKAAAELTQKKQSLILRLSRSRDRIPVRDYLLSDSSLDRYNRLGVKFNFEMGPNKYLYDGQIYKELVKRFPQTEAGQEARKQLERK